MIKLVYIVKKRADISEKDFHEYWLKKHGPLVRSFAKSMRAKKYMQSHTVSEDAGKQIRNTRPRMTRPPTASPKYGGTRSRTSAEAAPSRNAQKQPAPCSKMNRNS